jgi:plastocyanin
MLKLLSFSLALLMVSIGVSANVPIVVSQKGKVFTPAEIKIPVGTTIRIDNDDRVLHHVYIESPIFEFDSGEQPPGRSVEIRFAKDGTFAVRCDIHPKMLMKVFVQR